MAGSRIAVRSPVQTNGPGLDYQYEGVNIPATRHRGSKAGQGEANGSKGMKECKPISLFVRYAHDNRDCLDGRQSDGAAPCDSRTET